MGSLNGQSSRTVLAAMRERSDRLVRRMMSRGPSARVAAVAALVVCLALVGHWAGNALVSTSTCHLDFDRPLSVDDLERARRALEAKGIACRVVDRKIEVASDQRAAASAELAKLNLGPPSLDDLRSSHDWLRSVWNTPRERDREERLALEQKVELYINNLEGVIRSQVMIQVPLASGARRERFRPSALVSLETAPDRPLPMRTIQAIPKILERAVPGLDRGSITVMDRDGRAYVDPGDPALSIASHVRGREEEIQKDVLEKLAYIPGVRVWVRLEPTARPGPGEGDGEAPGPARDAGAKAREARSSSSSSSVPIIGVNQPIELAPKRAGALANGPALAGPERPRSMAAQDEHGHVLVNVPRSFYHARLLPASGQHKPSREEMRLVAERAREQIVRLVNMVVPSSWKVDVDTVPDDVASVYSEGLSGASTTRRAVVDWTAVAATVGALALIAGTAASRARAARRPARPSASAAPSPRRHRFDGGEEPCPSERVRTLVRRDPEAAASVLQRWASEGGSVS